MNAGSLGMFAAKFMEHIEGVWGEEATVRTVAIVAEVDTGDATTIVVSCDDDRPWVQLEFLNQGIESLEIQRDALLDED